MAKWWCRRQYNGDTRPEILKMVTADLEEMNHIGLAWLYREAVGRTEPVHVLPDNFEPWK